MFFGRELAPSVRASDVKGHDYPAPSYGRMALKGRSMASVTRPRIQGSRSLKATAKVAQSGDSREKLLKDVMREMNIGLDEMSPTERASAIANIHAIAENIRKRQVESVAR